ncbi:MAG: cytochrome c oxidase subunit 3 [Acidimicrobiia bacterium]|jgi:heme/copper-type cytochrome/quinol oxidase subunit 3|nr:MAG: cytochrome c oxidase subunit 3 [Acidimicrobiia bacterium]
MSVAHDVHESTGIENRKLGMWAFLSSEFLFFGALISNYLLFKGRFPMEDPLHPINFYDIPFTSISSFILLMSSLTMVLAHHALSENDQRAARTWLLATAALGLTFLSGQFYEFSEFVIKGASLSAAPVWSSFFVLTGFHGAHVAIGVLMLLILFVVSLRNDGLSEAQGMNLELVGLYWHFVDIIWIVIFTVIYLIP